MGELTTVTLSELDLVELTQADSAMEVHVSFPFSPEFPASTGLELEGGHNVVYFEIPPGRELATHEDSPEELVLCLEGEGIEAWAGDAEGEVSAGDLAVIPPMAPHGFRNAGETTARFLGAFSDSTSVSEFEADLRPLGERVVRA